jgi:hypothetical protein
VLTSIQPGQKIRCARCSKLMMHGVEQKGSADRLAWRSLWLGLASFVLLFFTGIPAIYYGVKSLLKMRFTPAKSSDRAAAIAGTALGGCVGVVFGFFLVAVVIMIAVIYSMRVDTRIAAEVHETCATRYDFVAPEFCNKFRSLSILNGRRFYFEFQDDANDEWLEIMLLSDQDAVQNKTVFFMQLNERPDNLGTKTEISSEILNWEFSGQPSEVRKRVFKVEMLDSSVREFVHYFTVQSGKEYLEGMSILFCPDKVDFDEAQAKRMFESTKSATKANQVEKSKSDAAPEQELETEPNTP